MTPACPECGAPHMLPTNVGKTLMYSCPKCGLVVLREGSRVYSAAAALLLELNGTEELRQALRERRASNGRG